MQGPTRAIFTRALTPRTISPVIYHGFNQDGFAYTLFVSPSSPALHTGVVQLLNMQNRLMSDKLDHGLRSRVANFVKLRRQVHTLYLQEFRSLQRDFQRSRDNITRRVINMNHPGEDSDGLEFNASIKLNLGEFKSPRIIVDSGENIMAVFQRWDSIIPRGRIIEGVASMVIAQAFNYQEVQISVLEDLTFHLHE